MLEITMAKLYSSAQIKLFMAVFIVTLKVELIFPNFSKLCKILTLLLIFGFIWFLYANDERKKVAKLIKENVQVNLWRLQLVAYKEFLLR